MSCFPNQCAWRLRCSSVLLTVLISSAQISSAVTLVAGEDGATDRHASDGEQTPERELTFEKDIRPILRAHCYDCHGATEDLSGGLDLRQVRLMQKGGDSGPAVLAGNAADSLILSRVVSGEMPPGEAKIKPEELDILTRWVAAGAKTVRPEAESLPPGLGITPEERAFWSFQPIKRSEVPELPSDRSHRVRTPIDSFLLAAMPEELSYADDADRHTLILRAHFDLIGLPPSVETVQQWLNDSSDDWFPRMVDSLLADPAYGERWARHWLDVAGYADSDGYTVNDAERPWAWKYRDYVIRSFNADKPFDRFIAEQLAGDELAGSQQGDLTPEQTELLTATGFLRTAADGTGSGEDNPTARNQVIDDTLKIVSTSLLGLSVGCAQCHDHRYDPIPQTDYFALRAVFAPAMDWQNWRGPSQRVMSLYTEADRKKSAEVSAEAAAISQERATKQAEFMAQALEKELLKYHEPLRTELKVAYETQADQRSAEQTELLRKYPSMNISPGVLYQYLPEAAEELKKFDARIAEVNTKRPKEEFLAVMNEPAGHLPETRLFHRGDFQQPKSIVNPGALTVACPEDARVEFALDNPDLPTSGRRLAFANWLTRSDNPLVARVLVNRFWLHHFGKGLVQSPSDFGKLGVEPTHPELLDWLADEFVRNGWSLKQLHRLILNSTAWRQSSVRTAIHESHDPDNRYYSRQSILRLDAELIRDRMLAASGRLSAEQFGSPAAISEDDSGQVVIDDNETRRSIYVKARRTQPVALLQAFDAPVMEVNCERRPVSTVATQSLMLMNSSSVLNHAGKLAERIKAEAIELTEQQLAALPVLPNPPGDVWQYGYGSLNLATNRIEGWTTFPYFNGTTWQAGAALPDPGLGYVLLNAQGGHPDRTGLEVIRRWTAPKSGSVSITGHISHGSPNGDGVRGTILFSHLSSGDSRLLATSTCHNGTANVVVDVFPVSAGDVVDFVVDCNTNHTSDSFQWTVQIRFANEDGTADSYESVQGFRGPPESRGKIAGQIQKAWQLAYCREPDDEELVAAMNFVAEQISYLQSHRENLPKDVSETQQAMINLCQALMTSNEFLYIK